MTERAALLIRRRRPIGEATEVDRVASPHAALLHGSSGAGRILHSLTALGVALRDLVQSLHDPESTPADLDALDVGRSFSVVILGSHLVNSPDDALRRAFLDAARRHVDGEGDVLIEHHPLDWAETAEPTQAMPGAEVGMRDVRRDPPFVSAVSVYDMGGRVARQPFKARVLSEVELEANLRAAGLSVRRRLSATWLQAVGIEAPT